MEEKADFQQNNVFYTANVLLLVRGASTPSIKILSIKGDRRIVFVILIVNRSTFD